MEALSVDHALRDAALWFIRQVLVIAAFESMGDEEADQGEDIFYVDENTLNAIKTKLQKHIQHVQHI